jgi:hypothetical protein
MKSRLILVAAVAAAALGPLADMASAASNRPILIPPDNTAQRRPGSHYSVVAAELVRQCADLESQFDRALADTQGVKWRHDAVALRARGGTACSQGERQQGIEQLRTAVREIGAVPRVTY